MNMVSCGEDCRYQIDGCCTRSDLIVNGEGERAAAGNAEAVSGNFPGVSSSKCCYFERR